MCLKEHTFKSRAPDTCKPADIQKSADVLANRIWVTYLKSDNDDPETQPSDLSVVYTVGG